MNTDPAITGLRDTIISSNELNTLINQKLAVFQSGDSLRLKSDSEYFEDDARMKVVIIDAAGKGIDSLCIGNFITYKDVIYDDDELVSALRNICYSR